MNGPKKDVRDYWSTAPRQAMLWTAVLGIHLGMLQLFIHAADRSPYHRNADTTRNVIMLRFIATASKPKHETARPKATTVASIPGTRAHARKKRAAILPPVVATATPTAVPVRHATAAINWSLPNATQPAADSFASRLEAARQQPAITHLPGSSVPIVKGLRMTDPRDQGIAGAVRTLRALFGVVDRHCVDVDVWRHLSTQELIDRHISQSDVGRTAAQYRCGDP